TGDGCIAALSVLSVMKQTGKKISELARVFDDVPQVLINCRVKKKVDLDTIPGYKELIASLEAKLHGRGRLFVRFSGTEPVIRVLVEGPDKIAIQEYAESIANFLEKELA
ncbi:MAG: phosphoglucosamine mutase, partial [Pseudobdellovibrionaceae bacterium]